MFAEIWQQVVATTALEWFGTGTGLAAVTLSIRHHRGAWPLFIACYAAYAWLSFGAGLLATAGMNVLFVGLSIDGWRRWAASEAPADAEGEPQERVAIGTPRAWAGLAAVWVASAVALAWVLGLTTSSSAPLDAAATTSGLVAQWLLTRKRIETWAFWLISDVAFMALYGDAGYWLTVGLFGLFVALALHGAWTWRRQLLEET